ncbi:protocadherin Fat 4-like isoform X2 [Mytilus edulis]|uniref:protocadherin Fat 4-like isoform X2 n=1 Tax=Mytilus edulis TaxID=6550 RepID=UPI0039F096DC
MSINLPESSPIGHQVLREHFTEVDGFYKTTPTAEILGPGSDSFSLSTANTEYVVVTVKNIPLSKSKYDIFVVVSVTVDGIVIRDFIHVAITINRTSIIEKNIFVIDGTPKDSVVGQVCQSCLSGDAVTTISPDNSMTVENDGSIKTTTKIHLDTLEGLQTIAYSSYIEVKQNGHLVANITILIVRSQYTHTLTEGSGSNTRVGVLTLSIPFSIDKSELALNNNLLILGSVSLDYQKEQEIHEDLTLLVSGTSFDIQINIKVQDVNDKYPVFLGAPYRFVTVQSAYTGVIVGAVTAFDPDTHANLTYEITPNDKLSINNNGVILVQSIFNTTIYNAKVIVRDGIHSDTEDIIIDIRETTNEDGEIKNFNGTILENKKSQTAIVTVTVPKYENYRFADKSAELDFTIESETGVIRNARAFDREKEQEFKLTIIANKENIATCSLAIVGVVTILVIDVNDEPPEFVDAPYNATVVEEEKGKELLIIPGLSTTDNDLNPTVKYSLQTHDDTFVIDSIKGTIRTRIAIDREKYQLFDIIVNAYDGVHTTTTTVTVKIIDINDHAPLFTNPESFTVRENLLVATSVGNLTANDTDEGKNAKITFDLVSDGGYFRINQTTGNILVARQLDRETDETHRVTVYARDNGDNILSATATVTFTIEDVNDNPPVFEQDQITVDFDENKTCKNVITKLNAHDIDKPHTPNSQIVYSLKSETDKFTVDNQSGNLTCKEPLDYEHRIFYEIIVEAHDNGKPAMSSQQTVVLNVKDINDNIPQFVDLKPSITVRYFIEERVVDVIKAKDLDVGNNAKIHFTIDGNASDFLSIDQNGGILRTKKSPNPTDGNYSLIIHITDDGSPSLTNSAPMTVKVQTHSKQSLKFNKQEINMTVMENSAQYLTLQSVSHYVSNPDNQSLKYEIIDKSEDLSFFVDESNGTVILTKEIDRERKEVHEFVIRVRNKNVAENSDLALVRVWVLDENDNVPLFTLNTYFSKMNENIQEGAVVSRIIATDADIDINADIQFTVYGESCQDTFSLKNEGAGNATILLRTAVDYEKQNSCTFDVKAFNPNKATVWSNATVVIDILDYNDNTPEFIRSNNNKYTVDVPEDTNINSQLSSFGQVDDKDSRENADIELTVVNDTCWFTVNLVNKEMFLKVKPNITLDYDNGDVQNSCTLNASDKGVPKLFSIATLSINIIDVNDNSPNIYNPEIFLNVSRDTETGTIIVDKIPASDIDSGVNGMLVYRFDKSEYSSRFTIDAQTGQIILNTVLHSVQKDEIKLSVIVSDKGSPQRSTRAQVTVKITDDNPRPFFNVPSVTVNIQEHTNIEDGKLGTVTAYDRRDGVIQSCDCTYSLDTKRGDIIIGKNTGVIKFRYSNHTLDREGEDFGQVIVGVIATDKGEHPKNSSTLAFKIKITDINDQVPVFNQINYAFGIFQYAPNGTCIGEVNATDLDENPETLYSIDITESSVGSVVEIDKSTGKIVKSGNMSLSSTQNVQIKGNVFAQDGKDLKKLPSHAEIIITIEFDDKNNHTPVFQKGAYEKDVDWKTPAGSKIITVIAEDADKGKEGEVTLSIIGGNSRDFFAINMVDDESYVVLKYQLDSSIGKNRTVIVNLTIKAEDKGIIPKSSYVNVKLRIFGDNPGTCIQGAEHSKELLNIESERDKWSYALYGLVAALCLAILLSFVFLYKWRTSPVSETTPPVGKMKYFDNPIPYDHLKKRETVEYSHSNESFDPPSRNCDFSDDKDQYQRISTYDMNYRF